MKRPVCTLTAVVAVLILTPISSGAASVEKVHQFFQVMGIQKMMADLIPNMTKAMINAMAQNHPNLPTGVTDIVTKTVTDAITPLLPQMQAASEKVYVDNLTDEEVTAAIAFYSTPTGQSLMRKLPAMTQQAMIAGQEVIKPHIPEMQEHLKQELQKRYPDLK